MTVAKWVRPSGVPIEKEGIVPDVVISNTEMDTAAGRDTQLEKALELVRALPYF